MPEDTRDRAPETARKIAIECKVKGQSFRAFFAALETLKGREVVAATTALLPREIRDAVEHNAIVTSGWYPMSWYAALHAAAKRACPGTAGLARQLGREQMRAEMQGIYKFVLSFFRPSTIMRHSSRIFALYCQGGKLDVPDAGPTFARFVYDGCHGSDANVWDDVLGSMEALLEASGARAVRSFVKSGGRDGDATMTLELRWVLNE
jgi:hypothetical protein